MSHDVKSNDSLLDRLNPAQRAAVTTTEGPLLVLAGPGSGKTRVITHRVAYLLDTKGVPASAILAVTFTNKAAREMKERLRALAPGQSEALTIGTFHAVCARILRRDGAAIGVAANFNIADDDDQVSVVKRCLKELNFDEKRNPPRALLHRISSAKSKLIGPDQFSLTADTYADEQISVVYGAYQKALEAANLLDFDDILVKVVELFRDTPPVLERYQQRYRYVLVDEFQDTNPTQYALVRLLGARYRNVCVVGDEDQSIYSWRQADIRNILNFESDFPDARAIILDQNYRSTRTIIQAARAVITPNTQRKEKRLFTENEEANYVATQIERLVASGQAKLGDVAVMYRVNSQSRAVEKTFLRHRLPHKVVGMRFFERKEIRDLIAYLRLIHNPQDVASFDRIINVPARQIGAKTIADLRVWAGSLGVTAPEAIQLIGEADSFGVPCPLGTRAKTALIDFGKTIDTLRRFSKEVTVAKLLDKTLELTRYLEFLQDGTPDADAREDNIRELLRVADEFAGYDPEASLTAFLEDAALAADADEYDESADAATLITFHAAKGLEFGVVFLVGMEDGISPHSRSLDEPEQLEEERRLAYVAITRARRRLFMTYTTRRTQFGESTARIPSRFFKDLPKELLQGTSAAVQDRRPSSGWPTPPSPTP
ncbi:MAG TPA: UvrD-helicase domain-containing protein, partial [Chloroflexota bacterium]|nr:UvrD-helicase domain-containing protein [Chloroflexota bacterium]